MRGPSRAFRTGRSSRATAAWLIACLFVALASPTPAVGASSVREAEGEHGWSSTGSMQASAPAQSRSMASTGRVPLHPRQPPLQRAQLLASSPATPKRGYLPPRFHLPPTAPSQPPPLTPTRQPPRPAGARCSKTQPSPAAQTTREPRQSAASSVRSTRDRLRPGTCGAASSRKASPSASGRPASSVSTAPPPLPGSRTCAQQNPGPIFRSTLTDAAHLYPVQPTRPLSVAQQRSLLRPTYAPPADAAASAHWHLTPFALPSNRDLSNLELSGTIPSGLNSGFLGNKLLYLNLANNNLNGTIPAFFANFTSVGTLCVPWSWPNPPLSEADQPLGQQARDLRCAAGAFPRRCSTWLRLPSCVCPSDRAFPLFP